MDGSVPSCSISSSKYPVEHVRKVNHLDVQMFGFNIFRFNVKVRRLGGAFGAKIIRNALISTAAAVAAYKLKKPVKIWMPLETNMNIIGKRYPLASDYEIAVDENGVIQYLNNTFYYDHGAGDNEPVIFLLYDIYFGLYNTETWSTNSNIAHTNMHASCYTRAPGNIVLFNIIHILLYPLIIQALPKV